jgi:tripartite ATP-independent transporter DctP family solute receptor
LSAFTNPLNSSLFRTLAIGVLLLSFLATQAVHAQPLELKLGHVDPKGSLYWLATEEFARRANEKLQGKAAVKVYRSGELGTEKDMLGQLQRGETALALLGQLMPSIAPEFAVFELPYLVLSRNHIRKVRRPLLAGFLRPAAKDKGFAVLALWETGFRHITTNVKPVHTPADLNGLRIRVNPGSAEDALFKSFGAVPFTANLDATYMQLKRNEIDAQHSPLILIKNRRFWEVQKYLSLTRHNYMPAYLMVNEEHFGKLDPEVRKVLRETAAELEDWVLDQGEKLDAALIQEVSAAMPVNDIDVLSFVMASLPVYQDYADKTPGGKALIKLLFDSSSLLGTQP